MRLGDELAAFSRSNGFGEIIGSRALTVPVYTGCILVPLPNIEARRQYLKYHDLHHLVTGYSVGRIGEAEMSAWELGTGSMFIHPALGVMNLIALSTGLILEPKRMWAAYQHGCASRNLYAAPVRAQVDSGRWHSIDELRRYVSAPASVRMPTALRVCDFVVYSAAALLSHAVIAVPAVLLRLVTDVTLGASVFQAVKPRRRADLY